MKIILSIWIFEKGAGLHSILSKEYITDMIPIHGAEVEDSAWKDPKIPASITCNFEHGYYFLNFEKAELSTKDICEKEVEMYRSHGWEKA